MRETLGPALQFLEDIGKDEEEGRVSDLVERLRDKRKVWSEPGATMTIMDQAADRIEELERLMDAARAVVQDLLLHAGIADAAPEDIDDVDRKRERHARAFLASSPAAGPASAR